MRLCAMFIRGSNLMKAALARSQIPTLSASQLIVPASQVGCTRQEISSVPLQEWLIFFTYPSSQSARNHHSSRKNWFNLGSLAHLSENVYCAPKKFWVLKTVEFKGTQLNWTQNSESYFCWFFSILRNCGYFWVGQTAWMSIPSI